MLQADIYCIAGFLYSAIVSLTSVSLYWYFERRPGWEWLADCLVVGVLALSMSLLAWGKVWMNKPSFSTGMLLLV